MSLTLTAQQAVDLAVTVSQLHKADQQAFLFALRDLLKDRTTVGDGELSRAVRSLWASGFFKPPTVSSPHNLVRQNKLMGQKTIGPAPR
jgi:hypothetical protein